MHTPLRTQALLNANFTVPVVLFARTLDAHLSIQGEGIGGERLQLTPCTLCMPGQVKREAFKLEFRMVEEKGIETISKQLVPCL